MSKPKRGSPRFKAYEKPQVEERFDFAELVRRQIERCLIAASDPEVTFPSTVQALEALIPDDLEDDMYRKEFEAATVAQEVLKFRKFCGRRMGSQHAPLMREERPGRSHTVRRHEDGSVDWSDPNIISPKLVHEEVINWHMRFEAAFNQFVRLGVAVRRLSRG